MSDHLRAYIILGFGVLCIGFSGIFVKLANAPGAVAGFYRMGIAVAVLALPFWQRQRRVGANRARSFTRKEAGIAILGGLLFAGDVVFFNTAVLISGATNPTFLGNTAPLWVGLGALIFYREKLPPRFWIGLLVAITGAALILGLDTLTSLTLGIGTLFGLVSGMFYGTYFLVTQQARKRLDALTYFWLAAVTATVVLFVTAMILGQPIAGYSKFTYLNLLGMGLLSQVLGQFAFSYSLGYLPASVVAPSALAQPVITALLAASLLDERISPLQALGGFAVLTGVFIVQRSRRQFRVARQPAPQN